MLSTASGPRNAGNAACHAAMCGQLGVALLQLPLHRLLEVPLLLLLLQQPLLLRNRLDSMLLPLSFSGTDECMLDGEESGERIRRAKLRLGHNSMP